MTDAEREAFIAYFPGVARSVVAQFNLAPEDIGLPGDTDGLTAYAARHYDLRTLGTN